MRGQCSSYTWTEIDRILRTGDVKGKLCRDDLPTPALLLDRAAFDRNIERMVRHVKKHNLTLRPHGKVHKCPAIAKVLLGAGAVGTCAAKLSEAEVFAEHGIGGLLITTEIIGEHKIERAVRLAAISPDTIFVVDNEQNIQDLNDAAHVAGVSLNLAIDLWVCGRTGIQPGKPALTLAQRIDCLPHVRFAGIQAYAGDASHVKDWEARRTAALTAMAGATETRRLLESSGIEVPLLSGASTGTYDIEPEIEGITELQPGSFMFMDISYNRIGNRRGPTYSDFESSLTVLATVISKPTKECAVVDAGWKSFATDQPVVPQAKLVPGLRYTWGGDEHGILDLTKASAPVDVGDRLEFIVPHCDPTVNLYDRLFCLRGDNVEALWKIAARGMSQ